MSTRRQSFCEPGSRLLLEIIDLIEQINRNKPTSEEDMVKNEVLLTAMIHWVQTIGEAANGVSGDRRQRHPEVPWRQIIDMRNLLAHGYRYVDPAIVWQVVVKDLPVLDRQMRSVLASLD